MSHFEEFRKKEKFNPDERFFYPGIADMAFKRALTEKINLAADDFERIADQEIVREKEYQDAIKKGLERFSEHYLKLDTEDKERICHYFEELMDIVGLESSGGHLNSFMYGFDPLQK